VDGNAPKHSVAFDDYDTFSQFRRVDGSLLPRGAAPDYYQIVKLIRHGLRFLSAVQQKRSMHSAKLAQRVNRRNAWSCEMEDAVSVFRMQKPYARILAACWNPVQG
jgi:hypothetical protein